MKDPQHPVKPAFDQAHNDKEAWRQQELAKLSDQQRAQYQDVLERQSEALKDKANELQQNRQDEIAQAMRENLSASGTPQHRMKGPHNSVHLHDLNRARENVENHLHGKNTPETERYAALLNDAQAKAEKQVDLEHKQTLENHALKQQMDRDRFLKDAAKERLADKSQETAEQFREAAKDDKQKSISESFDKATQDRSLQNAIEKAAEQESARGIEQEHDLENDPNRNR